MKKLGLSVVGFLLLLGIVAIGVYGYTGSRMHETVAVPVERLTIDFSNADPVEGKRLATTRGCVDCHGDQLQGRVVVEEPPIGVLAGPNLTKGKGSVIAQYNEHDWVRAIRFGVNPQGRKLIFMPSNEFYHINDSDLASLIAYIKSAPPVGSEVPVTTVGPLARALYIGGRFPMLPFEKINMSEPPVNAEKGATAEYGRYLTMGCTGCHGTDFKGGPIPGVPPAWPHASNLTPAGAVGKWTLEQFKQTLRTGTTPEGKSMNPMYMPWPNMAAMTDQEIEAIFLFLKTLAP